MASLGTRALSACARVPIARATGLDYFGVQVAPALTPLTTNIVHFQPVPHVSGSLELAGGLHAFVHRCSRRRHSSPDLQPESTVHVGLVASAGHAHASPKSALAGFAAGTSRSVGEVDVLVVVPDGVGVGPSLRSESSLHAESVANAMGAAIKVAREKRTSVVGWKLCMIRSSQMPCPRCSRSSLLVLPRMPRSIGYRRTLADRKRSGLGPYEVRRAPTVMVVMAQEVTRFARCFAPSAESPKPTLTPSTSSLSWRGGRGRLLPPTEADCSARTQRYFLEAAIGHRRREESLCIKAIFERDEKWADLPPFKRTELRRRLAKIC